MSKSVIALELIGPSVDQPGKRLEAFKVHHPEDHAPTIILDLVEEIAQQIRAESESFSRGSNYANELLLAADMLEAYTRYPCKCRASASDTIEHYGSLHRLIAKALYGVTKNIFVDIPPGGLASGFKGFNEWREEFGKLPYPG